MPPAIGPARSTPSPVSAAADFALVIDALFGAGLARDLDGEAALAVERMNVSGRPILAVDMPSGIDGDTGAVRGTAVRAMRTVTFARRKPGHLLLPGRAHCGSVAVADIGIADETIAAAGGSIVANAPALWAEAFPRPTLDTHKYRRGHALVLSGGGAPYRRGAARRPRRAPGRGRPRHACLARGGARRQRRPSRPRSCCAAATGRRSSPRSSPTARFNAVALGPALGVGASTRELVAAALAADRATVLDADALTSFEGDAAALAGLAERCARAPVLTPHEGEFARLFKAEAGVLDGASKLERARRAAALTRAIVVLKGADTVIAAPDGRAAINENGTPDLATAGSGDVLDRHRRRAPGAGDAAVRGGLRRRLGPRRGRAAVRAGADRRGSSGGASGGPLDTPGG